MKDPNAPDVGDVITFENDPTRYIVTAVAESGEDFYIGMIREREREEQC